MREYTGIPSFAIPDPKAPDFTPRLRNMLSTIDHYLRDTSFALGRIDRGERPSGGGGVLGVTDHGDLSGLGDDDHAQYAHLGGRLTGQVLYGGTTGVTSSLTLLGSPIVASSYGYVHFTPTPGSGVTVVPQTGRIGINKSISTIAHSIDIVCESGNASGLYVKLASVGSGPGIQVDAKTVNQGVFAVDNTGIITMASYTAQSAVSIVTVSNVLGNDSSIPLVIVGKSSQAVNLQEWRSSAGAPLAWVTKEGYLNTTRLQLADATGDLLTIVPAVATTAHTLTMPATQGASSTLLQNDGSGGLSWVTKASIFDTAANYSNTGFWDFTQPTADSAVLVQLHAHASSVGSNLLEVLNPANAVAAFIDTNGSLSALELTSAGKAVLNYSAGTGFGGEISVESGSPTQYNIYTLPTSSPTGSTIAVDQSATLYSLFLGYGSKLVSNTASQGASFADNTTATKRMRFVLSGAVGNNNIVVSSTAARAYTLADDSSTLVGRVASSDATGQTGAFADTTLYTTIHAGFYRISAYLVITAYTGTGNITVDATWTDPAATTTDETFVTLTGYTAAGNHAMGSKEIYCTAASVIRWRTTFSGTATYSVYGRIEAL